MQRAIRRIKKSRMILTENPIQLRQLAKQDLKKRKTMIKENKLRRMMPHRQNMLGYLRIYSWNMCSIANCRFPPTNWDNGMAILAGKKPPGVPTIQDDAPPSQNPDAIIEN